MGHKKLILDLVMGAGIPWATLTYGTDVIGARPAFIIAGVVPALYVLADVLFITRRFNAITTIVAVTATTQGGLSFLQVDGWRYALQDTAGTIVMFLLFAGSLIIGKPIIEYFVLQVLEPASETEEAALWRMLRRPGPVRRAVLLGMGLMLAEQLLRGVANYLINLYRVTSKFGTPDFNNEKAAVTAMTWLIFTVTYLGAMALAITLVYRAIDHWLDDVAQDGGTLLEQINRKLARLDGSPSTGSVHLTSPSAAAPPAAPPAAVAATSADRATSV